MRSVAAYGTWDSPVTASLAAAGAVRIRGVCLDGDDVYWVEERPTQGGRNVVVRRRGDGGVEDVTPAGWNVRTRVHEYGGGAFTAARGTVFFTNDADQRIWRQAPGAAPVPITPQGRTRFADLTVDDRRRRLVCVREDHSGGEPENTIVAVPLEGGDPQVLVCGADFFASPRPSPDGAQLAYVCWHHGRMPWEGTELFIADADGRAATRIAGGERESVVQPLWDRGGSLCFISDRSGWWNLYRWRGGATEALCPMDAEFAGAPWVFGLSNYGFVAPGAIACTFQQRGTWHLGVLAQGALQRIAASLTEIGYLQTAAGRGVFAGGSPLEPLGIHELAGGVARLLYRPSMPPVDTAYLSRPESIDFDGAHGLFYAPHNPRFEGPSGECPPLIVMSHGGPTSCAQTALSLPLQFWTSRGFAVLDVNYRGSTGYGRAFREALNGVWGIADVEDCVAGARALVARGLVDGGRLLIRGGSAGGYTTLAALTFTDVFRAGASYYGVSDLEAIAHDTHKFESRYLDTLIGPLPARRDLYLARSPIHHVDRLACPVIFFQGLEDKVVPPDQAERMVEALRHKGLPVEYVTFPDEQHGFRRAENVARALEAELAFYRRVLDL